MKAFNLRLPDDLRARLTEKAKAADLSLNAYLVDALLTHVDLVDALLAHVAQVDGQLAENPARAPADRYTGRPAPGQAAAQAAGSPGTDGPYTAISCPEGVVSETRPQGRDQKRLLTEAEWRAFRDRQDSSVASGKIKTRRVRVAGAR